MTRKTLRAFAAGTLAVSTLFGTIVGLSADTSPPASLGGADRYLTYVSTDKPIYRPGEKLYVRAAMLRADHHTPLPDAGAFQSMIEITGPKGDVIATGYATGESSVAGFSWEIPANTPGGEYSIKVSHPYTGHTPAVRKFDVRAYRAPRLKSQTVFLRDGYGPGDTAQASLHVDRAEGGIPENAKVTAVARVDGVEVARVETQVDDKGNCSAQFKLPDPIARGEGTLAWIIEDGGVVETATKTIPILLQTVDLSIYPEGGDLVAGLPNRVYLEAFTPAKKPADLQGVIVDAKGNEVSTFRTEHEGRGRFELKPEAGETYTLKITQPTGIKTTYPLPQAKETGAVLRTNADVFEKDSPVLLQVAAPKPVKLRVTLNKREVELSSQTLNFTNDRTGSPQAGELTNVTFTPPSTADGVLVATLRDADDKPIAERLIFRKPARSVNVKIEPDQSSYIPAARVNLRVTTTDADGKPLSAFVGLAVTDDSVQEMIETREQAPRLPAMVLLETDVKDLADAHVYLNPDDAKAPLATDLLLGTQGWRRFATVDPVKFVKENGEHARRALAIRVSPRVEVLTALRAGGFGGGGPEDLGAVNFRFFADGKGVPEAAAAVPAGVPADRFELQKNKFGEAIDEAKQLAAEFAPPANQPVGGPQAVRPMEKALGRLADLPDASKKDAKLEEMDLALVEAGEREAGGRVLARRARGRAQIAQAVRNDFVVVREYAHRVRPERKPTDRVDFAETLYWNAAVKTDESGVVKVSFDTSDAVTAFRVLADAFTPNGALGTSSSTIQSIQPFYVEPKMPLQLTSGDVVKLPLALVNSTKSDLSTTLAATTPFDVKVGDLATFPVKAGARERRLLDIDTASYVGTFDFSLTATATEYQDKVTRKLTVSPRGFPIEVAFGGMLGPDNSVTHEITIPADVVPLSLTTESAVYPTPLANLTQALEALIRSPSGCFEQTSSTTYPLVMAQQYFISHAGVDPKLIERSSAMLTEGYNRLMGFECKTTRGFEWFGADPGHEALSAYGLLEFTDMAQVREVDKGMLERTRKFILSTRDGKGGFKRERQTLHTWIDDPECSNGYITWSLLVCGEKGLEKEVAWMKDAAMKSNNSYAVALGANIMYLAGDKETAKKLMDKLVAKQHKDGFVDGATTSIVGSGGEALQIETTSLAILAWLNEPSYAPAVEKSMTWLAEACKAGRFGSTQSTVLALRAIVAYDKARAKPKQSGVVRVILDGKVYGEPSPFSAETQGAIPLQNLSHALTPGKHTIKVEMERGSAMPYSVAIRYNATKPDSSEQCKVNIGVSLKDAEMKEGNVTEANVTVTNKTPDPIPTPIAIVGIPAGLEVRHDQLKELVKAGRIAAYEVLGREVVLYWRGMKANESVTLPISLVAAIPGTYTAPASRAYLYYTDELKQWVPGVSVKITPATR